MNSQIEVRSIKEVIQKYMEGTYEADAGKLKSVFHKKAVMNGYLGGDCVIADPSVFIADITSMPSMKSSKDGYHLEIESVNAEGNVASVSVSETGFRGEASLVDFFHLIKIDGEWKIISKLFTTV